MSCELVLTRAVGHLGWTVGEVEESRKGPTMRSHVCHRATTCLRAARASLVHVRRWECVHACVCVRSGRMRLVCLWVSFFFGRGKRVLTLSYPERLSVRATPLPKGVLEHALRPQLAVLPQVSGEVAPEHTLLPPYWESTLTAGLSPLESLESHTQSGTDSPLQSSCIPHLLAYASRGLDLNGCECSPCRSRPLPHSSV